MSEREAEQPAPVEPRAYRDTIGLFTTGVAVVAVRVGDHVHAMTANAVASLSLDPPLVMMGVSRQAKMAAQLETGRLFSINILRAEQQAVSNHFAGRPDEGPRPAFEFDAWAGTTRLRECAAALACRVEEQMPGGDHWIVLGRVLAVQQETDRRPPLVFFGGEYRQLTASDTPAPAPDLAADRPVQTLYDPR